MWHEGKPPWILMVSYRNLRRLPRLRRYQRTKLEWKSRSSCPNLIPTMTMHMQGSTCGTNRMWASQLLTFVLPSRLTLFSVDPFAQTRHWRFDVILGDYVINTKRCEPSPTFSWFIWSSTAWFRRQSMGRALFLDIRMSFYFTFLFYSCPSFYLYPYSSANPFTSLLQLLGADIDMLATYILPFLRLN
jgi:hypothetical protein